jgi:hypothetical protein
MRPSVLERISRWNRFEARLAWDQTQRDALLSLIEPVAAQAGQVL